MPLAASSGSPIQLEELLYSPTRSPDRTVASLPAGSRISVFSRISRWRRTIERSFTSCCLT